MNMRGSLFSLISASRGLLRLIFYEGLNFLIWVSLLSMPVSIWAQASSIDARFRQAIEAMRGGHLDEAGDAFASIAKDSPNFAEAHLNLGLVREEQGRNDEAIA